MSRRARSSAPIPTVAVSVFALAAILVSSPTPATGEGRPPYSPSCPSCGADDFGYRFHHHDRPARAVPGRVGQEAMAAIQEVVALLAADPETDWSEVNLARLREHLVDLDRVMIDAEVAERAIDGGVEATVTGAGRTLEAIRRLVPAHARGLDGFRGWRVAVEEGDDGVVVTLTTGDPAEVEVTRALGFFGFMASGVHHPHQLLAVARGRSEHWPATPAPGR